MQMGAWRGTIRHPDGEIAVDAQVCRATKDRSWGVRALGEPEGGAPALRRGGGMFFVWAPLFWEDHVTHTMIYDDNEGRPISRSGLSTPLYRNPADIPMVEDPRCEHFADTRARVKYIPGTRLAASAQVDLVDGDGGVRTIACEPILKFQMNALGYGHPKWAQGVWHGEEAMHHESFDPATVDPLAPENLHVQQVVRLNDGTRKGVGVFEHICTGPNAKAGFTGARDGAPG
jgi:hypothetical protein